MAGTVTIQKAKDEIGMKVKDYIKDIAIDLSNEMKREAPVYRGRLRDSIQVQESGENRFYVGTNVNYAKELVDPEPRDVLIEPLEKWARRKLNVEKPGSWAVATGIQKKIATQGINKNDFVGRAVENVKKRY